MECIAKVSFELEEWIFGLLLGEEERKRKERAIKLKEIERMIFVLSELVGGLKGRQLIAKREKLAKLLEERELVRE
ncbi:MAG: hypothetical protein J6P93_01520 [Alphaproteobacteria bacterium]|nr:hypothetical protein [Alphaproteobacteria bacterium]